MKILVPTSIDLDYAKLPLREDDQIAAYDPTQPVRDEDTDAEVLIAWANTDDQLADCAARLKDLRLIQALMAGPDQIKNAGFPAEVVVCAGVGLHDKTVSEHAIMLSLALVRSLPELGRRHQQHEWAGDLGGPQPLHPKNSAITTLLGARVTVWGFGSIAKTLAPLLTALGAQVTGIARSAGKRDGYEVVATEDKDELLARTDLLIMILPSGEATADSLDAQVLQTLPDTAYVVNVGRGSTVDEAALVSALEKGEIAGAAIDVAKTEPLPASDPLWDAPHLIITPHAAGGRPVDPEELIGHNLQALRGEGEFRNRM